MLIRLYRLKPRLGRVALLEFTHETVRTVRVVDASDADGAQGLEGPLTAERLDHYRSLLANGYALTRHDPDDSFFRDGEVISLDDVLKEVGVVSP